MTGIAKASPGFAESGQATSSYQSAIPGADPNYEWVAVALLSLGFGLVGLDRWIIAPLAPVIVGDLGISAPAINALIAILGITWGVAAVLMGSLSDKVGRRKVLLPSILIFSLASGLSGVATSFMSLLLIRGLMGVAEGAFCPTSFAAAAEASKPSRIGFNQGLRQSMFALVGLLCAMCGIFVLSANTPLYLTEYLKLSPIQVGLVTSAIGFGGFAGQRVLPALSDIFGRRPMAVPGFLGGALFVLLFINTGAAPGALPPPPPGQVHAEEAPVIG
jgi:MFS family permease